MSRNRGLLIYLEALIQRGEIGIKVCYEKSSLRAIAWQSSETVITRSNKRRSNLIRLIPHLEIKDFGPPASGGHESYQCSINADKRLRNKCAMTCFGKKILSLGRHKFEPVQHSEPYETACRMAESKRSSETSYACERGLSHELINCKSSPEFLSHKVYSLFTTHHSLKRPGATHVAHWNNFRKIAFTLAEVLITLGIIGVVAAMTMPSLITNYRVKETVSKLKKVNTIFNNAFLQAKEENGEISDWGLSNSTLDTDTDDGSIANSNYGRDKFLEILSKHLKTISMCKYSDNSCEVYRPTNLQGDIDNSDSYSNRLVLADGTIIGHVYLNNTACNTNWGSGALSQSCGSFKVDLNGSKKPNMYGKDIFQFDITANGIVPSGIATDISGNNFEESCIKSDSRMNGVGCTGWVIYNENMDYLKCPEKLGWDKAKSCK